jgi:hypothetical protein
MNLGRLTDALKFLKRVVDVSEALHAVGKILVDINTSIDIPGKSSVSVVRACRIVEHPTILTWSRRGIRTHRTLSVQHYNRISLSEHSFAEKLWRMLYVEAATAGTLPVLALL